MSVGGVIRIISFMSVGRVIRVISSITLLGL